MKHMIDTTKSWFFGYIWIKEKGINM